MAALAQRNGHLMPIYEYKCTDEKCAQVTEKLRKMSEVDDPVQCEKCDKEAKRTFPSRTSFQLKGGGWYADGYSS